MSIDRAGTLSYIPVVSIIVPFALVIEPATTPEPSDDGCTLKLILNISSPSIMLSFVTATLTVVLVAPAGIVAMRGVVLKSLPSKYLSAMST